MAWPVTDFDNVQFNGGAGYAEVAAIHLAIKERADATGHSLASGDYAGEWDGTSVWLGDPVAEDGRLYLKDVLQRFYDDIGLLLEFGLFWSTESGGDTKWTAAGLVADIDLGDWEDLLTAPQNHLPFLWLHEALNRLVYFRALRGAVGNPLTASYSEELKISSTEANKAAAWAGMVAATPFVRTGVAANLTPQFSAAAFYSSGSVCRSYNNTSGAVIPASTAFGAIASTYAHAKWEVIFNESVAATPTLSVSIDGASSVSVAPGVQYVEVPTADIPLGAARNDISFSGTLPGANPFVAAAEETETFGVRLTNAYVYFDLAGILEDQS